MFATTLLLCATSHAHLDSAKLYAWFDTLGHNRDIRRPFVLVFDSQGYPEKEHTPLATGFLVDRKPGSFSVLFTNMSVVTFPYSQDGVRYRYVTSSFAGFLKSMRKPQFKGKIFKYRYGRPKWFRDQVSSAGLAWICHRNGRETDAKAFLRDEEPSEPRTNLLAEVKDEIAYSVYGNLILQIGDPSISWSAMGAKMKIFAHIYRGTRASKRATAVTGLLNTMAAQEATSKKVDAKGFARLSTDQKVAELIRRIRTVNDRSDSKSPEEMLAEIGLPAVPRLLDALRDKSFTRDVDMEGSFIYSVTEDEVVRVRDVAIRALSDIAGRNFWGDDQRDFTAVEKNAQKWWAAVQANGEKQVLIGGVEGGGDDAGSQAQLLVEHYPQDAFESIFAGLRVAKNDYVRGSLIEALSDLPAPKVVPLLKDVIANDPAFQPRFKAVAVLAKTDPEAAITAMGKEWEGRPGQEPDSHGSIAGFLAESCRPSGIGHLATNLRSRSVADRERIVEFFMRGLPGECGCGIYFPYDNKPFDPVVKKAFDRAVEDLLAFELEDKAKADGYTSLGNVFFDKPELSSMAVYGLAECFPGKYRFKFSGSAQERERQRLECLRVYRLRKAARS